MAEDFYDIQMSAQQQMQSGLNGSSIESAAESLRDASANLSTTNQNQLMIMQQQMQLAQMQNQSINGVQAGLSNIQSRFAPIVNGAKFIGAESASMARQAATATIDEARQASMNMYMTYGMGRGQADLYRGNMPGVVDVGYGGNLMHGMGATWDTHKAQSYTFGAYNRAHQQRFGEGMAAHAQGAMNGMLGNFSFSNAAGMGASALANMIPIAGPLFLSDMAYSMGSRVGGMADFANPIVQGMNYANHATMFGANANNNAFQFMRGNGSSPNGQGFSLRDQDRIGTDMVDYLKGNFTYSNDQILGLQNSFNDNGLMLGVNNSQDYSKRIRSLIESHKVMMKNLQMASKDMAEFMGDMYNQIGYDPGREMIQFSMNVGATSRVAGIDTAGAMSAARSGMGAGSGMGMLNRTGASFGLAGRSLAATTASQNISTPLLASVGGEEGLGQMIAKQNMQFMSGSAGAIMAFGGNFHNGIGGALSAGAGGFGGSSGMVNFLTDRHNVMDKMSPDDILAQRAAFVMDAAKQMGSGMGSLQDRMRLVLMSQGMSSQEAEATMGTFKSASHNFKQNRRELGRQRSDLIYDAISEQGIGNRLKLAGRNFMNDELGSGDIGRFISRSSAMFGEGAEIGYEKLTDAYNGISERAQFDLEDSKELLKSDMGKIFNTGAGSSLNRDEYMRVQEYQNSGGVDLAGMVRDGGWKDYLTSGAKNMAEGYAWGGFAGASANFSKNQVSGKKIRLDNLRSAYDTYRTNSRDLVMATNKEMKATNNELIEFAKNLNLSHDEINRIREDLGEKQIATNEFSYHSVGQRADFARGMMGITASELSDSDADYVFGSNKFQKFANKLDELYAAFDPNVQVQGKDYKRIESEALAAYTDVQKDGKLSSAVQKMLSAKRISIGNTGINFGDFHFGGGSHSFSDRVKMAASGATNGLLFGDSTTKMVLDTKKRGVFGSVKSAIMGREMGKDEVFNVINTSRKSQQAGISIQNVLSDLGVGGNLDLSAGDLSSNTGNILSALHGVSDDKVKEYAKAGGDKKVIAAGIMALRNGGGQMNKMDTEATLKALLSAGITSSEGLQFKTDKKLDPKFIASKVMENQKEISSHNLRTAQILDRLAKDMELTVG